MSYSKTSCYLLAIFGISASLMARAGENNDFLNSIRSLDSDLPALGQNLFQLAYSEFDAIGKRESYETRFIPNHVLAYSVEDKGKTQLIIVGRYSHARKEMTENDAKAICQSMLYWHKFQLGIKDNGTPIAYASDFDSSALYRYVRPKGSATQAYASSLDSHTRLIGHVAGIRSYAGASTSCSSGLVE